ncbi:hypothetical protein [Solimonas marina]|uniref:DUF3094 family protein n=1 Tax=Solimonas marina TaxID=2714601 RepID=A0A969WDV4_9GAMM|nr:hypothetical protein [Solimonas marina]NKF22980.1 hypothetical protein [Solimonas marina]
MNRPISSPERPSTRPRLKSLDEMDAPLAHLAVHDKIPRPWQKALGVALIFVLLLALSAYLAAG